MFGLDILGRLLGRCVSLRLGLGVVACIDLDVSVLLDDILLLGFFALDVRLLTFRLALAFCRERLVGRLGRG